MDRNTAKALTALWVVVFVAAMVPFVLGTHRTWDQALEAGVAGILALIQLPAQSWRARRLAREPHGRVPTPPDRAEALRRYRVAVYLTVALFVVIVLVLSVVLTQEGGLGQGVATVIATAVGAVPLGAVILRGLALAKVDEGGTFTRQPMDPEA